MKNSLIIVCFLLLCLFACDEEGGQGAKESYTNEHVTLGSNLLTPEALWMLGRVGDVSLSPDKQEVLYSVSWPELKTNKMHKDLYIVSIDGENRRQLTHTPENEHQATWSADGEAIYFLSSRQGSMQLYVMDKDGTSLRQLTNEEGGIQGYKFAHAKDGKEERVVLAKGVKRETRRDKHSDLPLANARIEDDMMYRHWDAWVDEFTHLFVGDVTEAGVKNIVDILEGEPWESPVRPFGGMEQVSWTPDNSGIVYTCRKKEGLEYAKSTNTDLYLYDLKTKETKNLTDENEGYDLNPQYSPDGKYLVWESMERDGYEADLVRLAIRDVEAGKTVYKELKDKEDLNVHSICWSSDSKQLYFISEYHGSKHVYAYSLEADTVGQVTGDTCNYLSVEDAGGCLLTTYQSISKPTEIYIVDKKTKQATELSFVNQKLLNQLKMGRVEARWVKTYDKKDMLVWVIYPPKFDKHKKYPTLLYCQGGPQSMVSQFFSYRWNFQLMAANDYIVVAPNRRGLPGFGREWNEQISGDYGGANMKDYLSAIDELSKEEFVDEKRLGAIGASYGGYSVYWLAGNHNKRFKTFVSHCGIFNFESMYLTTEENWFVEFDYKGNFWEDSKQAKKSYDASPHKFLKNWDTPILCIHGAKDFRIPYTQGMQAFHGAKYKGLRARFLYFPEEGHWVLSAQNGVLWHREFFAWLDEDLK